MNTEAPIGYVPGIKYVEGLNANAMRGWLDAELKEKVHVLSGQADDFPVQAIVNHFPYLTLPTQKRLTDAISDLIMDWRETPNDWTVEAVRSLLSLAAEFRVSDAKTKLQTLIGSVGFSKVALDLRPAVLRAVSTLSTNADATFWRALAPKRPEFAGMAFQVLTRVAPHDAILLLGQLPADEAAVDGVARKLPDFVSQHEGEQQAMLLSQIAQAFEKLPSDAVAALNSALKEEGFDVGTFQPPLGEQHRSAFLQSIILFAKTLHSSNNLSPLYAREH